MNNHNSIRGSIQIFSQAKFSLKQQTSANLDFHAPLVTKHLSGIYAYKPFLLCENTSRQLGWLVIYHQLWQTCPLILDPESDPPSIDLLTWGCLGYPTSMYEVCTERYCLDKVHFWNGKTKHLCTCFYTQKQAYCLITKDVTNSMYCITMKILWWFFWQLVWHLHSLKS